jgi:hypothetical protein
MVWPKFREIICLLKINKEKGFNNTDPSVFLTIRFKIFTKLQLLSLTWWMAMLCDPHKLHSYEQKSF